MATIPGHEHLNRYLKQEIDKTGERTPPLGTAEAVAQLTRVVAVIGSHVVDALYDIANQIERTRSSL